MYEIHDDEMATANIRARWAGLVVPLPFEPLGNKSSGMYIALLQSASIHPLIAEKHAPIKVYR